MHSEEDLITQMLPASCFLKRVQSLKNISRYWVEMTEISPYQSQNSPPDYPCHSFQKLADDCIEMAETVQYRHIYKTYLKDFKRLWKVW